MKRAMSILLASVVAASLASARPLPLKVLYLGLSKGFAHSSVGPGGVAVTELGNETGLWTTKVSTDIADLAPAAIGQWDVIFFYTTGDLGLDAAAKQGLLDWVAQGGGFGGFHSATDTYYEWPEYGQLIGGYFAGHPWNQMARFKVENADHPLVAHLWPAFDFLEEIYIFRNYDPAAQQVLVSVDNASVDASKGANVRPELDYALLWAKEVGQGRVVYNGFGHHDGAFADPRMRTAIVEMVKWLTKMDWQTEPEIRALVGAKDVGGLRRLSVAGPSALGTEPVQAMSDIDTAEAVAALRESAAAGQGLAVREAALAALGRHPQASAADLAPYLDDAEVRVRLAALRGLGRRTEPAAREAVVAALDSPHQELREMALDLLVNVDDPAVNQRLRELLRSADPTKVGVAATVLANSADPAVAEALLTAAREAQGPTLAALPALITALSRYEANDAVYGFIREQLRAEQPAIRAAAARALASSARADAAASIAPLAFDADRSVADAAGEALAKLPAEAQRAYLSPYLTEWSVLGPFERDLGRDFGPEAKLDAAATYPGQNGTVAWKRVTAAGDGLLNFKQVVADRENSGAYAWAVIESPQETDVQLRLSSDDGAKVWLNGAVIHEAGGNRGLTRDSDRVPVRLRAGRNDLLVKVEQGGGDWSLAVRFGSAGGNLGDLRFGAPTQ